MYYYGGSYNYAPYPAQQQVAYGGSGGGNWLAIILVVFLLLIIVGSIGLGGHRFGGGCCHREG